MEARITETAKIRPFVCACGSGNGPFVETTIETRSGRLYLCQPCLTVIVETVGVVPQAEHDRLVEAGGVTNRELAEARQQVDEAQAELAELRPTFEETVRQLEYERQRRTHAEQRAQELEAELRDAAKEQAKAGMLTLAGQPKPAGKTPAKPKTKQAA